MELPLILAVIILAFTWTHRQKSDDWNDVYTNFNELLRVSSEMCESAIQNVLHIMSQERNQNLGSFDVLNTLFHMDHRRINVSKTVNEKGTCKVRSWKDAEETSLYNYPEECLKMVEIKKHLDGIFEDMVQSGRKISSIKEELPGIVEANCAGEDYETCKLHLLLSAKSHVTDLLTQASVNVKIISEIMNVYRRLAVVCLENI